MALDGKTALFQVTQQSEAMGLVTDQFERGFAHLGWLLLEVAQMQYWKIHFDSFNDYLKSVAVVSKKTPGQLRQYYLTVRDLSDTFKPAQLELMGITKAIRLRAAKDYALVLPAVIVNAALDPDVGVKELKKVISTTLKMPEEEGDWMDLDGFVVSVEERALVEQAILVAARTEPVTKQTMSASSQMKDVVLKWCMEFLGAHSGDGN